MIMQEFDESAVMEEIDYLLWLLKDSNPAHDIESNPNKDVIMRILFHNNFLETLISLIYELRENMDEFRIDRDDEIAELNEEIARLKKKIGKNE